MHWDLDLVPSMYSKSVPAVSAGGARSRPLLVVPRCDTKWISVDGSPVVGVLVVDEDSRHPVMLVCGMTMLSSD